MKKYKARIDWQATLRGSYDIIAEGETKEEAIRLAKEETAIDYTRYIKLMDRQVEVIAIEDIEE